MNAPRILAKIRAESPTAATWRRIFGTDTVLLTSATPVLGRMPSGDAFWVLFVDVHALSAEQLERVVAHLAEQIGEAPETVRADLLGDHGLPVPVDDLIVLVPIVPIGSA